MKQVVRRDSDGYYVRCRYCRRRVDIVREDLEDGWVECEECGRVMEVGDGNGSFEKG